MTDPTLPRRAITPVPPQPGLLRAIRAEARRRRVRRLQVAGASGTTALALVSALVLTQGGGASVGLEPVTPVGPVTSPAPIPAEDRLPAMATLPSLPPAPASGPAGAGVASPPADVTASDPAPSRIGAPVSAGAGPVPDDASATRPRPPVVRSERDAGVQPPCTAGTAVPDWCLAAVVDSGDGGERSTLQLLACPTDRTATRSLSYSRTEETRFVVSQAGRLVWSSDDFGSRANSHVVTVGSGRCLVWAVEWDQTDDAGSLVEPGDYVVTATSYAAEVADAPSSTAAFKVGAGGG